MSLLARPFLPVFTTLVLLVAPPVAAQEALPMPEGEPLLTVNDRPVLWCRIGPEVMQVDLRDGEFSEQ